MKCFEYGPRGRINQHFIFSVIYEGVEEARVFVPDRPLKLILMFADKTGSYLIVAPVQVLHSG
jgi:hypothetical protein